jgi:membrane-bound lytic murein transglycosylase D
MGTMPSILPRSLGFAALALAASSLPLRAGFFDDRHYPVITDETFTADEYILDQARFWYAIYIDVGDDEGLLHDPFYPDLVFRKAKAPGQGRVGGKLAEAQVNALRAEIMGMIAKDTSAWTPEDKALRARFPLYWDTTAIRLSCERIRFQRGLKGKYRAGLERSYRYLPLIDSVFTAQGVPSRLRFLPHVESSFYPFAYSKVGAAGMWQFMKSSAKHYKMKVTYQIDERRDPLAATVAAARMLAYNHTLLQSWPLAIVAYNHGPGGLANAARSTGTRELSTIIKSYYSNTFGFASKNFYAEFLAASSIALKADSLFPGLRKMEPLRSRHLILQKPVGSKFVCAVTGLSPEELEEYNLALRPATFRGNGQFPKGFALRLPASLDLGAVALRLGATEQAGERLASAAPGAAPVPASPAQPSAPAAVPATAEAGAAAPGAAQAVASAAPAGAPDAPGGQAAGPAASPSASSPAAVATAAAAVAANPAAASPTAAPIVVASAPGPDAHPAGSGNPGVVPSAVTAKSPPPPAEAAAEPDKSDNLPADANPLEPGPKRKAKLRERMRARLAENRGETDKPQALLATESPASNPALPAPPAPTAPASKGGKPVPVAAAPAGIPASEPLSAALPPAAPALPPAAAAAAPAPERLVDSSLALQASDLDKLAHPMDRFNPAVYPLDYAYEKGILSFPAGTDETISHYAEWAGLSEAAIRKANGMRGAKDFRLGRRIKIPLAEDKAKEFMKRREENYRAMEEDFYSSYYVSTTEPLAIEKGQNLWTWAQDEEIPFWLLQKHNPGKALAELHPGDSLNVPVIETGIRKWGFTRYANTKEYLDGVARFLATGKPEL